MTITASQWIVLDNAKNNWPLTSNLDAEKARAAVAFLEENGLIENGRITRKGEGTLLANPSPKEPQQ